MFTIQDPHIQYTMETENFEKSLQFLDLNITNINGRYEYKIHRKNAITNVQVKPNSGHDPKVLKGIFTGFLHRAHTICEGQNQKDEIDFLVTCFVENGYDENELKKIIADYLNKRKGNAFQEENLLTNTVTLPWIPGLSPKLRKSFRKQGYKTIFKSSMNLKTILTARNKTKLTKNSLPGVYMVNCKCGSKYVGETSLKVSTRLEQHQKSITDKKWDLSGISNHAQSCKKGFEWDRSSVLKVEDRKFDRKVREALEIQFQETSPHSEHGLNQDDGQYVTTNFWKPMLSHLREKSLH